MLSVRKSYWLDFVGSTLGSVNLVLIVSGVFEVLVILVCLVI